MSDMPNSMDADYIKKMITPAVNTILEMAWEGGVDIEEEHDLWDLVLLVYPNYVPGAQLTHIGADVYTLKCVGKDGTDRIYYKIGEDRAMAAVKLEVDAADVAYVQVNKLVEDNV